MAGELSPVEQAVARTLRDNLEHIQRTADELHQAINDLVAACASSRASNALPPMLRAQTNAAALSATLEVLSKFVTGTLQPVMRMPYEPDIFRGPSSASAFPPAGAFEPPPPPPPPPPTPREEMPVAPPAPPIHVQAAPEILPPPVEQVPSVPEIDSPDSPAESPIETPVFETAAFDATVFDAPAFEAPPFEPPAFAELSAAAAAPVAVESATELEILGVHDPAPVASEPALDFDLDPPVPSAVVPPASSIAVPAPMQPIPAAPSAPPKVSAPLVPPVLPISPLPPTSTQSIPVSVARAAATSLVQAVPQPPPPAIEAPPAAFSLDSLPPEEQELHRRAYRVAKVSMQDIRMLRPEDVRLGRQNKDLCTRLRDDIEKAHKEYDRRFQAIQNHPVDYFYDWMVEILGGGDPKTLGEYPYSSSVVRR